MACGRISGSDGRLHAWSLSVHWRCVWIAEVGRMRVRSGILHLSSFYDLRAFSLTRFSFYGSTARSGARRATAGRAEAPREISNVDRRQFLHLSVISLLLFARETQRESYIVR